MFVDFARGAHGVVVFRGAFGDFEGVAGDDDVAGVCRSGLGWSVSVVMWRGGEGRGGK
jgi:hypothetical protein